jgi:hypothetical protein
VSLWFKIIFCCKRSTNRALAVGTEGNLWHWWQRLWQ